MRLKVSQSRLVMMGLALLLAVSCTKKPVKSEDTGAAATGEAGQGVVVETDKPMALDAQGSDSGNIAGLNTVYFEYDQARLTEEARKKLADNAEWIKAHPKTTIQVEGHTDSRGSIEYNLALGERRAKSVKSYLQSLGVEAKRVTIISYGEEKPLDPAENEAAWAKNRRANFVPIQ